MLDRKSMKHLFVGYNKNAKAYRLDVSMNKVVVRRDVVLDVNTPFFFDSEKKSLGHSDNFD